MLIRDTFCHSLEQVANIATWVLKRHLYSRALLCYVLLIVMVTRAAAVDVQVPTLTPSGTSLNVPFGFVYSQSRVQSIYTATEIGASGTLRSLSVTMNSLPGQILENCTIRLKQTTASSFASASWDSGLTTVFQGSVKVTATGKVTFPFSVPFTYSAGSNNLIVDLSMKNPSGIVVNGQISFYNTPSNRSMYYGDTGTVSTAPTSWSGTSPLPILQVWVPVITLEIGPIVYVSSMATGSNNGTSWANAYNKLSDAITNNPAGTTEIWVRAGTYKPTDTSDQTISFALRSGLSLYGGFGGVEVSRFQRDGRMRPTILSGDIQTANVSGDNSYHVVSTASSGGLLSGFIIRDGYAFGSGDFSRGGGLYMTADATINDCVFALNSAVYGGGLSLYSSYKLTMDRCVFLNNSATAFGGGAHIFSSQANTITNTVFNGNSASDGFYGGGGFFADGGTVLTLTNCTFANNSADGGGGGLETYSSSPTVRNTIFWGNTVGGSPNQIFSSSTGPTVTNCLIQGGVPTGTTNNGGLVVANPQFLNANDVVGPDNIFGTGDDGLTLKLSSPAINAGNATGITITDGAGNRRVIGGTVDIGAYERTQVIYVDANAAGSNTGASWVNAYTNLVSALTAAAVGESEIWLANGSYFPSTTNNRNDSFRLVDRVALYGGFNTGELDLLQRNTGIYRAILSGDIGVADTTTDNSYHVVRGANGAIVDGISIVKGYANGGGTTSWSNSGAGLLDENTSTTLVNCVVAENESTSYVGGGVASVYYETAFSVSTGATQLRGTVFTNNKATYGGGLFLWGASGDVNNCTFSQNQSSFGGAIYAHLSAPLTITNSILYGDSLPEIYNAGIIWIATSDVQGSKGSGADWLTSLGVDKGGNLDDDPNFAKGTDPRGADNAYGTSDDGLRLLAGSRCIDVGTLAGGPQKDILGIDRPAGGSPDLGAYEGKIVFADFQLASSSFIESTANPGILLQLSEASDIPVTVTYVRDGTSPGDATIVTDFSLGVTSVTFAVGETAKELNVTIANDLIQEGNDTIGLSLTGATNARLAGTMYHLYTITNDDTAGITTSPTILSVNESGPSKTFTLSLTSIPANSSTVTVVVSSSVSTKANLTFGASVNQPSVNVVWSAGSYGSKVVTVSAVNDSIDDGNVDLQIITQASTSTTDSFYTGKDPANVDVTVVDNDDVGLVTVINALKAQVEVTEVNVATTDSFTVRLNSEPTGPVQVNVTSSNSLDAIVDKATLSFTVSGVKAWNIAQTVTVTAINDQVDEPGTNPIPFSLTLDAVSGDGKYDVLSKVINGHLTDNDSAQVLVTPSVAQTPSENGGTVIYDVVLATKPTAPVTIGATGNFIRSNTIGEGDVSGTTLTFGINNGPGGWDTPQQITVTAVNDDVDAANLLYTITFPAPISTDAKYSVLPDITRDITNADDDTFGITFTPSTGIVTSENGTTGPTIIRLASQPTGDVTVRVQSDDITEGRLKLGAGAEANFVDVILTTVKGAVLSGGGTTAGWDIGVPITIVGQNDIPTILNDDVTYHLDIINRTSTDTNYSSADVIQDVVTILNQDESTAGVAVTPIAMSINENAGEGTFTVSLTKAPAGGETVTISLSHVSGLVLIDDYINTGDALSAAMTLDFTLGNYNSPRTVRVTAVDNSIDAADVITLITTGLTSTLGGGSAYNAINPSDVTVTVVDDDIRGVTLSPTTGLTTTESGGQAIFSVVLNSQPTLGTVSVTLRTNDNTEGKIRQGVSGSAGDTVLLTFTPANWNAAKIISVVGQDDSIADGPINYTVDVQSISAGGVGDYASGVSLPTAVTISNTDNEVVGVLLSKTTMALNEEAPGNSDTYTIRLTSQPANDVEITFDAGNTARVDTDNVTTANQLKVKFSASGFAGPTIYADGLQVNWDVPLTIYVTAYDDAIADGTHKAYVTHQVTSTDLSYNGFPVSAVEATITDDDTTGITTSPNTVAMDPRLTTKEDQSIDDTLSIVLATQPRGNVTILLSSDRPDEAIIVPDRLTLTPSNYNNAALHTVQVQGVDDDVADGSQPFAITATVVSADGAYDNFTVSDIAGDNQDDDVVGVAFTATTLGSPLITTEAGGTAIFTVRLTSEPTADVTVSVNSSNTDEGKVTTTQPLALTFTSVNWNSDQIVTITGQPDNVDEALASTNYTVTLSASGASSGYENNESYNLGPVSASGTVFGTNTDIDQARVNITPLSGLLTSENGTTATYSIVLNSKPSDTVRVEIDPGSPPQLGAVGFVEFTTMNWNVPQSVIVTAVNDAIAEGTAGTPHTSILVHTTNVPETLDLTYKALPALDSVSVLITDNDNPGFSITKSVDPLVTNENPLAGTATSTFRVNLTSEPTSIVRVTVTSADPNEVILSLDNVRANATASVTYDIPIVSWNLNTAPTITAFGVNDDIDDNDKPIAVTIAVDDINTTDVRYDDVADLVLTITNGDKDTAAVTVTEAPHGLNFPLLPSDLSENVLATQYTYTLVLTSQPTADVTITINDDGQVDIIDTDSGTGGQQNTIIFTPMTGLARAGNTAGWNVPVTVFVIPVDDLAAETSPHTATVTHIVTGGGYNGVSAANVLISVADNDASTPPVVTLPAANPFVYDENGHIARQIDAIATVNDVDSPNFHTGNITVSFTSGGISSEDVLSVRDQGTAAGQVSVSGIAVSYNPLANTGVVQVASLAGGIDGNPLIVSLSSASPSDVSLEAVQAILRQLTYRNSSLNPTLAARTITVTANDGDGGTSTVVTKNITITPFDDPPTMSNQNITTAMNYTVTGQLLGSDPEGLTLTFAQLTNPTNGTLTLAANGAYTYVPLNGDFENDYTFTANVSDGVNNSSTATVTIRITGGLESRPIVIRPPPFETDATSSFAVVGIDSNSLGGSTLNYAVLDLPVGFTASITPLSAIGAETRLQINWTMPVAPAPNVGDHFTFGVMIIDVIGNSSTYLPVTLQYKAPGGSG